MIVSTLPPPTVGKNPRKRLGKIPDEIEFYMHQIEGVRWMARRPSLILADDMGLGKSLQALTVAAVDFDHRGASRVLVVCPANLKRNWQAEISKLTHFSSEILDGSPRQREAQLNHFSSDILITNYEQIDKHLDALNRMLFDVVIYDEAHYLKNYKSKRTKAALKLDSPRHLLLTGTPILNRVDELWPLLHRAQPAKWPNYFKFINEYCIITEIPVGKKRVRKPTGVKPGKKVELLDHLAEIMLRREKDEALDLPDKIWTPIYVDLSPAQREYHDAIAVAEPNPAVRFLRQKQVCSTTLTVDEEDDSAKLDVAVERAVQLNDEGRPVVIFTQFRRTLEALGNRLMDASVDTFALHGDITPADREVNVDRWRTNGGALLCMYQVAGTGWTFTEADTVILVDKLYTPKLNDQAVDRLHRIGQTNHVTVLDLIAVDTVEHRIEKILAEKKHLFDTIIDAVDVERMIVEELSK